MTKNKDSTRYYSSRQENYVANLIEGRPNSSSGSSKFNKSDVLKSEASLLIECKTPVEEKASFSIKKEWLSKLKEEAFGMRLSNTAIAFEFAPNTENYFVINESLFKFLVEKLEEEYK